MIVHRDIKGNDSSVRSSVLFTAGSFLVLCGILMQLSSKCQNTDLKLVSFLRNVCFSSFILVTVVTCGGKDKSLHDVLADFWQCFCSLCLQNNYGKSLSDFISVLTVLNFITNRMCRGKHHDSSLFLQSFIGYRNYSALHWYTKLLAEVICLFKSLSPLYCQESWGNDHT